MFSLSFTPASISYLTQFILSLAISIFLALRLRNRVLFNNPKVGESTGGVAARIHPTPDSLKRTRNSNRQQVLLFCFFAMMTAFIGLLFLDSALSPFPRLLAVYAENTVLALSLVFLIQFAYRFPRPYARRKWEARASLIAGLAYLLLEAFFMVYRYVSLFQQETVYYRPLSFTYANALVLLWVPIAFLRQSIAADPRPVNGLTKLWNPQGKEARGARTFVFIFAIPFVLGAVGVFRDLSLLTTASFNISLSVGILIALWLFASTYINFVPGGVSVLARLSILTLTLFLAMLGSVGWLIAPPYIDLYRPDLTDHQTLRFAPNASGGYDVSVVDFSFETTLGDRLQVQYTNEERNQALDFVFPFYGRSYTEVYATGSGAIGLGQAFWQPNLQARRANAPAIFPLLIELDPNAGGGLYARQEPDRLILTWDHLPALFRPEAVFTFQVVLYQNGVFEITYNGLPLPFRFDPDETPSANPWLRGTSPGRGESLHTSLDDFSGPLQTDQRAIIQNFQLDFRRYLHEFMLPLAWVVIGGSLLLSLGLPALVRFSLIRPLEALSAGVRKMEAGDYDTQVPVHYPDEIGFLTRAFNDLAARLGDLIRNLEARVAVRTAELSARTDELDATNVQLRAEIAEREQAQATVVGQQRALATLEERDRLGRELHDGLGQVLGYINVQAQAAEGLLEREQLPAARANLQQLASAAREAHDDVRTYILGLRSSDKASEARAPGLFAALRAYLAQFEARYGLIPRLFLAGNLPQPLFAPGVEEQVVRLVQEALTNAGKHAQAGSIEVTFGLVGDQVQITVTDDGVGFAPADLAPATLAAPATQQHAHFGLEIMRERAERVGGRLEIQSAPGQGTRIVATLPCFLPAEDEGAAAQIEGLRLLLVDDHPLFLDGLRNLLLARGLTVVGLAHDGDEALVKTRALRPDVVVMDLNMPRCDGLAATRAIKSEMPEVQVVILTVAEDEESLFEAIKSGASGYLLKSLEANRFCSLLAGLLRGEAPLSPGLAERVLTEFAREVSAPSARGKGGPDEVLTPRQWEILCLVADGMTYKEIGAGLHLSEKTIKYHMGQILQKLHVDSRAQAIAYAHRRRQG